MGNPQRLPAPDAPLERGRCHETGTGKNFRSQLLHTRRICRLAGKCGRFNAPDHRHWWFCRTTHRRTAPLRLGDVWRVPGHIEVTARKSKTRQRRLVEICPALAAWLDPYRTHKTGSLWNFHEITFQQKFLALCEAAEDTRKTNGLRHAFCTYDFAAHANENQTAQQAGNSPAMIHAHYKGLATNLRRRNGSTSNRPTRPKTSFRWPSLRANTRTERY